MAHLEEELGDLLFQVYFHATLAAEAGRFTLADVARGVHDKLVSRHPHVFGDVTADTPEEVAANWEALKLAEKGRTSVTEGIPAALPGAGPGGQAAAEGPGRGHGPSRRWPTRRPGWPTGWAGWRPAATDRPPDGPADRGTDGRGGRRRGRPRPSASSCSRWPTWPGCSGSTPRRRCGPGPSASGPRSRPGAEVRHDVGASGADGVGRMPWSAGSRMVTFLTPSTGVTTHRELHRTGHRP